MDLHLKDQTPLLITRISGSGFLSRNSPNAWKKQDLLGQVSGTAVLDTPAKISGFRVRIQGQDSGLIFRNRIKGQNSGSAFRFGIQVQDSGSGFRVKI